MSDCPTFAALASAIGTSEDREANDHYVGPSWCSEPLFQIEEFTGSIDDPCAV